MGATLNSSLPFLESALEVSAKLKQANTKERKLEEVVKDAEPAAVLVLVYGKLLQISQMTQAGEGICAICAIYG